MKRIVTILIVAMMTIAGVFADPKIPRETEAYGMCWGATDPETVQTFWTVKNFLGDENPKLELVNLTEVDAKIQYWIDWTMDKPVEIRTKFFQCFFRLTDDTFLIVHLNLNGTYMKAAVYRVL